MRGMGRFSVDPSAHSLIRVLVETDSLSWTGIRSRDCIARAIRGRRNRRLAGWRQHVDRTPRRDRRLGRIDIPLRLHQRRWRRHGTHGRRPGRSVPGISCVLHRDGGPPAAFRAAWHRSQHVYPTIPAHDVPADMHIRVARPWFLRPLGHEDRRDLHRVIAQRSGDVGRGDLVRIVLRNEDRTQLKCVVAERDGECAPRVGLSRTCTRGHLSQQRTDVIPEAY